MIKSLKHKLHHGEVHMKYYWSLPAIYKNVMKGTEADWTKKGSIDIAHQRLKRLHAQAKGCVKEMKQRLSTPVWKWVESFLVV